MLLQLLDVGDLLLRSVIFVNFVFQLSMLKHTLSFDGIITTRIRLFAECQMICLW
jgi:hypothetical protein